MNECLSQIVVPDDQKKKKIKYENQIFCHFIRTNLKVYDGVKWNTHALPRSSVHSGSF